MSAPPYEEVERQRSVPWRGDSVDEYDAATVPNERGAPLAGQPAEQPAVLPEYAQAGGDYSQGRACLMAREGATGSSTLLQGLIHDTLAALPIKPTRISDVTGPYVEITKARAEHSAVDMQVSHHFRAHFDNPAALGIAALPLLTAAPAAPSAAAPSGDAMALPPPPPRIRAPHIVELLHGDEAHGEHSPRVNSPQLHHATSVVHPSDTVDVSEPLSGLGADKCPLPFSIHLADITPRVGALSRVGTSGLALQSQASSGPRPLAPWQLDPNEIIVGERLAVGGFAEVFMGKYQGTLVAVKLLLNVEASGRDRFMREVAFMASLRHPHLLLFMGYAAHPHLAIVSEFMHRGSLFKVLRRGGNQPLDLRMQRTVAVSVARGMAYLHSRTPPLLHLDLKSPNILIDDRWRVKIADFGLSRVRYSTFLSGAGAGTPEWMAPELLRSEPHDEHADVFSYGVVLWEILTGKVPWEGLHPMQVVAAVGFQGRSLQLPEEGDAVLLGLCRRCMDPLPGTRPSFAQIVLELEEAWAPSHVSSMRSTLSEGVLVSHSAAPDTAAGMARELPLLLTHKPASLRSASTASPPSSHPLLPTSRSKDHPSARLQPGQAGDGGQQIPPSDSADVSPFGAVPSSPPASTLDTPFAHLPPFDDDQPSAVIHVPDGQVSQSVRLSSSSEDRLEATGDAGRSLVPPSYDVASNPSTVDSVDDPHMRKWREKADPADGTASPGDEAERHLLQALDSAQL